MLPLWLSLDLCNQNSGPASSGLQTQTRSRLSHKRAPQQFDWICHTEDMANSIKLLRLLWQIQSNCCGKLISPHVILNKFCTWLLYKFHDFVIRSNFWPQNLYPQCVLAKLRWPCYCRRHRRVCWQGMMCFLKIRQSLQVSALSALLHTGKQSWVTCVHAQEIFGNRK